MGRLVSGLAWSLVVDFQERVRMMEASMGESHMHRVYPHRLSLCIVILGLFPHSQVERAQSSAFELPSVNTLQSKFLCLWTLMSLVAQ